ncbi:MAG: GAF domain-containing sensor histidine kinase [Flavipsychrobacter sp.]
MDKELERVINLAEYDIEYQGFKKSFDDLTELAAAIAGTNVSLINLIDSYTQWTIANYGMDLEQMPRADSVCQYTIQEKDHFEIIDLSKDNRFKDKSYVAGAPLLKYYYGIPLSADGHNIGALCVLDQEAKLLSADKVRHLRTIANEIIYRLKSQKEVDELSIQLSEIKVTQNKLAHDVRGPLSGIISLTSFIKEQGAENNIDEVLEFNDMINKSCESLVAMSDDILNGYKKQFVSSADNTFKLSDLKERLEHLYSPQAKSKNIHFAVTVDGNGVLLFPKNVLTHIIGNLIANAIKFTSSKGSVRVSLHLLKIEYKNAMRIIVKDSGIGMSLETIDKIMSGNATSTNGTGGEAGFGFGLALVKHLIDELSGSLKIVSVPGEGTSFDILLKQ